VEGVRMEDGIEGYTDYNMLGEDGTPAAGVRHARGVNADLPPVWMIYLPVADLAESLHRVQVEGGRVIKAIQSRRGEYVYAAVQDPVGAYLALVPALGGDVSYVCARSLDVASTLDARSPHRKPAASWQRED
jgi:uncharacterized protein